MPETPEIDDDSDVKPVNADDTEATDDEVEEFLAELDIAYELQTDRMRALTSFLRATMPRIGITQGQESGHEIELQTDVESARNLAVISVYQEIRRITGGTSMAKGDDAR